MRLLRLDTTTGNWVLRDFPRDSVPFYAILSHTWGRDQDAVKFEDVAHGLSPFDDESKSGFEKLRFCYRQAAIDGLTYFWIDTCCIDKSSSAELQASLSSMFYWYQKATICYAFLSDVSIEDGDREASLEWEVAFAKSRWFKRGWTLQELLAPKRIVFFSKEGRPLGHIHDEESHPDDKEDLTATVSHVTRIPNRALRGMDLSHFSVEQRLTWTKDRVTTVPEDTAYCLIGIFGVRLQVSYQDGRYNELRDDALAELRRAIALKNVNIDRPEVVIRVGGASWSDLTRLSGERLEKLDSDLDSYLMWLLNAVTTGDWGTNLTKLSQTAGERMRMLLVKYGVDYEDLSRSKVQSWKEPWELFKNRDAPHQARVRALVENRWYWTKKNEDVYTCITAVRTFEELMIWRGRWTRNVQ